MSVTLIALALAALPARYGEPVQATPTPLEQVALDAALGRYPAGRRPRVAPELVVASRELAALAARDERAALSRASARGALARALAFDPAPVASFASVSIAGRGPERDARLRSALAGAVARSAAVGDFTDLGAGAFVRGDAVYVVLLTSRRRAVLDPFPRDVARGARAELDGALLGGLEAPRVFVTDPSGRAREVADRAFARGRFRAALEFPERGRYSVEVVGSGPGGPEVAALLTVSCAGAPLDEPAPPPLSASGPDPADPGAAEQRVVDALNAERRARGLPTLAPSPALQALARDHSAEMLATGVFAHVLPGSGELGERLRRARVPYRVAGENIAKGPTALAAHGAAAASPAHLENILSRDFDRVGVGIARGKLSTGDPIVYLTEIFARMGDDDESPLTPAARAFAAISAARERARLPALAQDARLDELALAAAFRMRAAGELDGKPLSQAALDAGYALAAVDAFEANGAAEAAESRRPADPRFSKIGIGVAPAASGTRLFIAVVYAH